jgi:hypothetical protein
MASLATLVRRREKKAHKARRYQPGSPERRRIKRKIATLDERIARKRRLVAPKVISRAEWGARAPRGGYVRQSPLIAMVIHHTAMPTLPASATVAQEKERMRQLQAIHQDQGWTDIGYARVVMPSGRIYEGRPAWAVGAHTLNHNTGKLGIALDGNFETAEPTRVAIRAARSIRREFRLLGRPIYGHYQLGPTACPGRNLKPYVGKEI